MCGLSRAQRSTKQVGEDILEFCDQFKVQAIGYDPAYADLVVGAFLMPGGLKCIPHRQGGVEHGTANEAIRKYGQAWSDHAWQSSAIESCDRGGCP